MIVTNGLQVYFNAKTGKNVSNQFPNLAPNGIVGKAADVIGGTFLAADGSLRMDGIDDSLSWDSSDSMWTTPSAPYTFEMVITPRKFSGDMGLLESGIFLGRFSWANLYWEFYQATSYSYVANQATTLAPMNAANLVTIQITFNGSVVRLFVNGTELWNSAIQSSHCFSAGGYTTTRIAGINGLAFYQLDFHAARIYNRELSKAELDQNRAEGKEIALTQPQVKTGVMKFASGDTVTIYDITGFETEKMRVFTNDGKGFIPLVPTSDPNASRVRMSTAQGIMALKK